MNITLNATDRKPLVKAISELTGEKAVYLKTPTYAYKIGDYTVTREGNLDVPDGLDAETLQQLKEVIESAGFQLDNIEVPEATAEDSSKDEITGICISMPRSLFTDANLENLKNIIAAKRSLICKALGTDDLPLEITDTKVSFPWFPGQPDADSVKAYDTFVCKLCEMARNMKRSNATEKPVDNDKYAFRCFLLRLGFIGAEYKTERKILLKNLTGSSAFKSGARKEVTCDEVSE
ncbi:MAG: virulence protein [Anaerovoracaceae bacterium]